MKPIPDDVEPVPRFVRDARLVDGGATHGLADAAAHTAAFEQEGGRGPECVDRSHHPLRVRQWAADRWSVPRGVLDAVRTDKAQLAPQLDASGHVIGLLIEEIGDGCLAVLGFHNGDLIRNVNGQELTDASAYYAIYRTIMKDGSAVVRFDRGGRSQAVVFELRNE
jgi:type II secretory pathway component PulC